MNFQYLYILVKTGDENLLSVTKLVIVKAHEILLGLVNDDSLTLSEKEKIIANRQQYQVLHDSCNCTSSTINKEFREDNF